MIATATVNYKDLLIRAMELRGRGGKNAYRRAIILVDVYENTDFIDSECQGRADAAERKLDAYVEDLCLTFMELRDMLRHFKRPGQWKDGRLKSMHTRMVNSLAAARKLDRPACVRPPKTSKSEIALLEQRRLHAEARAAHLERELARRPEPTNGNGHVEKVAVNGNGIHFERVSKHLVAWRGLSDDERLALFSEPEFQAWCNTHGFSVAALPRLASAGH